MVGITISYGRCLDLTTAEGIKYVREAFYLLRELCEKEGRSLPANRAGRTLDDDLVLRYLDCAVIEMIHLIHKDDPFDTVRGMFTEGTAAYPGAGYKEKTHTQIAVVNPKMIKGFFLPREPRILGLLPGL